MTDKEQTEIPAQIEVAVAHLSNANLGILHKASYSIYGTALSGALIFRRITEQANGATPPPEPQESQQRAAHKAEEPAAPVVSGEVLTDNVAAVRNLS